MYLTPGRFPVSVSVVVKEIQQKSRKVLSEIFKNFLSSPRTRHSLIFECYDFFSVTSHFTLYSVSTFSRKYGVEPVFQESNNNLFSVRCLLSIVIIVFIVLITLIYAVCFLLGTVVRYVP